MTKQIIDPPRPARHADRGHEQGRRPGRPARRRTSPTRSAARPGSTTPVRPEADRRPARTSCADGLRPGDRRASRQVVRPGRRRRRLGPAPRRPGRGRRGHPAQLSRQRWRGPAPATRPWTTPTSRASTSGTSRCAAPRRAGRSSTTTPGLRGGRRGLGQGRATLINDGPRQGRGGRACTSASCPSKSLRDYVVFPLSGNYGQIRANADACGALDDAMGGWGDNFTQLAAEARTRAIEGSAGDRSAGPLRPLRPDDEQGAATCIGAAARGLRRDRHGLRADRGEGRARARAARREVCSASPRGSPSGSTRSISAMKFAGRPPSPRARRRPSRSWPTSSTTSQ